MALTLPHRLQQYLALIRFDRPIGTLLLLWPALWGLWVASAGPPPLHVLLVFVLGVFLMRSAGCAINDFADRDFDGSVQRTCGRPLATGAIAPAEALGVFVVLALSAFLLVLTLDRTTILMSLVAAFFAVLYPFMKRYTHLPQLFLGIAFGWAVPMAFTAVQGEVPPVGWLLFAATVIWALIYDTEYAMVDREDDLRIGVKSTAILFGAWDRLIIGLLQLLMLGLLGWVGYLLEYGWFYALGLLGALISAGWQQWLIRDRETAACFRAFLNNNFYGISVFAGIFAEHMLG